MYVCEYDVRVNKGLSVNEIINMINNNTSLDPFLKLNWTSFSTWKIGSFKGPVRPFFRGTQIVLLNTDTEQELVKKTKFYFCI